MYIRKINFK